MNSGFLAQILSLTLLASPTLAQESNHDELVRGFVSTRGTVLVPPRQRQRRPKPKPSPVGLGYTLFKKNAEGAAVRVNPAQEFQTGDEVKFVLESNINGYLYIFHQMNDAPPKLLYPDARLTKWGDNRIEAHELKDLWFKFVAPAAVERFYLVVARTRLPAVLSGERLVAYCQQRPEACPWRPAEATWKQLLAQTNTATRESRSPQFGALQTETERRALLRDVRLQPADPAPAVIKVSAARTARALLALVELTHK
jgi:hypothetical protein